MKRSTLALFLGAVAGGLVLVVAGVILGLWLLGREKHPTDKTASDAEAGPAAEALADHPWWKGQVTPERASAAVAALAGLQSHSERVKSEGLAIFRDGSLVYVPNKPSRFMGLTWGQLNGAGLDIQLLFLPGTPGSPLLSRREATELLRDMLDAAQQSDENVRRRGYGDGILDQVMHADVDPETRRQEQEALDRLGQQRQRDGVRLPNPAGGR